MRWPTPQDYNEAVQNPQQNFGDDELKDGSLTLDQLGLPRPVSGNFATVYKVNCPQAAWAVRCFLHNFQDQQERYDATAKHLANLHSPYLCDFTFIEEGIKVKSQWYPILKMEWVEGEHLDQYVRANLHDSQKLNALAEKFRLMVFELARSGIAHGDLQHGNILLVNDQVRLVDYDCMFVPALAGFKSNELGHRHYQHPLRRRSTFSASLDNFSSWVIYTSLLSLSIDPSLYSQLHVAEECLLFKDIDFEEPRLSKSFTVLEHHSSDKIRDSVKYIRHLLSLAPDEIPPLTEQPDQTDIEELVPWTDHPQWMRRQIVDEAMKERGFSSSSPMENFAPGFMERPQEPGIKLIVEDANAIAASSSGAIRSSATTSSTTNTAVIMPAAVASGTGLQVLAPPAVPSEPASTGLTAQNIATTLSGTILLANIPISQPLPAWSPPAAPQSNTQTSKNLLGDQTHITGIVLLVVLLLFCLSQATWETANKNSITQYPKVAETDKGAEKSEIAHKGPVATSIRELDRAQAQAEHLLKANKAYDAIKILTAAISSADSVDRMDDSVSDRVMKLKLSLAEAYDVTGQHSFAGNIFGELLDTYDNADLDLAHAKHHLAIKDYSYAANLFHSVKYDCLNHGLTPENDQRLGVALRMLVETGLQELAHNQSGTSELKFAFDALESHPNHASGVLKYFRERVKTIPPAPAETALEAANNVATLFPGKGNRDLSDFRTIYRQVALANDDQETASQQDRLLANEKN